MKQCPLCKEHFADQQRFCDADGTPLIDTGSSPVMNSEVLPPLENSSRGSQVWPIVTIGILIGIIICLTAYAVMMTPPAEKANNRGDNAKLNPTERTLPTATTRSAIPAASIPEPSPEASPTGTASPTPAVAAASQSSEAALNTGPISTDRQEGEKRGHMLIKMKSGVTVEADAAWADRLGIWYRQGGLVSYVERDRIESIAEPPQTKNSPAETNKP